MKKAKQARKNKSKVKSKQQAKVPVINEDKTTFSGIKRPLLYFILFAAAFALYANSIPNEFAFDDMIVITDNDFTKSGISGIPEIFKNDYLAGMYRKGTRMYRGGRYRPLSLVLFAIEYQFFGENPHVNHFMNVLLFAISCVLLFMVLDKLFLYFTYHRQNKLYPHNVWFFSLPFVATMLYIAHPIHTEVVANIKGRDEIMAFLGGLATLWFSIKYVESNRKKYGIYTGIAFLLALLSKENAITFLAIIPLSIYFFDKSIVKAQSKSNQKKYKNKSPLLKYAMLSVPLLTAVLLFFIMRHAAVGEIEKKVSENLMTNPFLEASINQRYATTLYTLGLYLKLLIIPYPLTFDYYPYHILLVKFSDYQSIISLVLYIALLFVAIYKTKSKHIVAYGIWFYLITLSPVSNVFFPVGVFMSERFLYMASLGYCIVVAYFIVYYIPLITKRLFSEKTKSLLVLRSALTGILAILIIVYSIKTISRNTVWKNNFTLFTTDVKTSSNSLKSTAAAGEQLYIKAKNTDSVALKKQYYPLAEKYFKTTVKIYPEYIYVLMYLARIQINYHHDIDKAMQYYKQVLAINPDYDDVYNEVEKILENNSNIDKKLNIYRELYEINPNRYEVNYNLGALYGAYKNDLQKSIFYLERAIKFNPKSKRAFSDLGVAYGVYGNFQNAAQMLEMALRLDPDDTATMNNLSHIYRQLGKHQKAIELQKRIKELN